MEDEEEKALGIPELFRDKAYSESTTYRLSTSNMPGKLYISGTNLSVEYVAAITTKTIIRLRSGGERWLRCVLRYSK